MSLHNADGVYHTEFRNVFEVAFPQLPRKSHIQQTVILLVWAGGQNYCGDVDVGKPYRGIILSFFAVM